MEHILGPIRRHANYAVQEAENLNFITGYIIEKMTELITEAEKAKIPRAAVEKAFLDGVKGKYTDAVQEAFAKHSNCAYYDILSMGLGAVQRVGKTINE